MKPKQTQLTLKALNQPLLSIYCLFIKKLYLKLGLKVTIFNMSVKRKRITLLKSPHVNKKAREQFEIKHYKVIITFAQPVHPKYIQLLLLNKPKIVTISIKQF